MEIVIDLSQIYEFFNQPIHIVMWRLFYLVGWLPIGVVLLWGLKEVWLDLITTKWAKKHKYVLLAIDIPRGNEQSPKAVENLFSYLAGAHKSVNLIEKYVEGLTQLAFSFEIVSIDGYTQFLIRTPVQFRDLVESAVYAQYPDAEITEVNDYTAEAPMIYPDDEYDVWGAEFIQVKSPAYPIKTYEEFEHQMGDPKVTYRDPMAALMDLTSSMKKGEQIWYQLIIVPTGFEWPKVGEEEISKILKEKVDSKKNIGDKSVDLTMKLLHDAGELIYNLWGDIEDNKKEEKKDEPLKMMNLKPKEKRQIEAIQDKVGKLGFETKIRFVYIAKKDIINKPKAVNGFVGFIKQFASLDLNNLKPDMDVTATSTAYFFKEARLNRRKNNIVRNYKYRSKTAGRKRGLLNVEELATLWHFPVESAVKAPLIQKASRRKAEPPMSLPMSIEVPEYDLKSPIFEEDAHVPAITPEKRRQLPEFMEEDEEDANMQIESGKPEKNNGSGAPAEDFNEKSASKEDNKGGPPENLPFA